MDDILTAPEFIIKYGLEHDCKIAIFNPDEDRFEYFPPGTSEEDMVREAWACDDASIKLVAQDGSRANFYIVYQMSRERYLKEENRWQLHEMIADYTTTELSEKVEEAYKHYLKEQGITYG